MATTKANPFGFAAVLGFPMAPAAIPEQEFPEQGGPVAKKPRTAPVDPNQMGYRKAISAIESRGSGDYSAVGPVTKKGNRAYGRYGIMDFNIGPWSQEVLGRPLTIQEFVRDKKAQDAIFDAKFGQLVSKYGSPDEAAHAWFTGGPIKTGNKSDGGMNSYAYVSKFRRELGMPDDGSFTLDQTNDPLTNFDPVFAQNAQGLVDKINKIAPPEPGIRQRRPAGPVQLPEMASNTDEPPMDTANPDVLADTAERLRARLEQKYTRRQNSRTAKVEAERKSKPRRQVPSRFGSNNG